MLPRIIEQEDSVHWSPQARYSVRGGVRVPIDLIGPWARPIARASLMSWKLQIH